MFGQQVHGRYLDAVLGVMQREVADHVAGYDPEAERKAGES